VFFNLSAYAQSEPVTWESKLVKTGESTYELQLTANTQDNWIIYSQHIGEDGPIPTSFEVYLPEGASLEGPFQEPDNGIESKDELFEMTLLKFKGPATFTQTIISEKELDSIAGEINFMTCDNKRCLPPATVSFKTIL